MDARSSMTLKAKVAALMAGAAALVAATMLGVFTYWITVRVPAPAFLACAALGGAVAGAFAAGLFGRPGWRGWLVALAGAVLATWGGAMLAGVFAVPQRMSLVQSALAFSALSPVMLVWLGAMTGVHLCARRWRGALHPAREDSRSTT